MHDRIYALMAALLCVALAFAGIYYFSRESPVWDMWKSDGQSAGKEIDARIPADENAVTNAPYPKSKDQAPDEEIAASSPDQVLTKQAPGEEIDIRPPENTTETESQSPKEVTDRIPATEN